MNLYFIILSFQTIGGAGQISTANGGTIPINDIRGTLLAKTNQSNKKTLFLNRNHISRKNDLFNKKTLIYRFRGNGIHKTRKAYTMQTCSSLSINRHVWMDTRHLQSCHSKSCISLSSTLNVFEL